MSEAKAPTKPSSEPKPAKVDKPEAAKKETTEAAKTTDTPAAKADAGPKSASQTSISHFSSVSTPEYKAGWDNIFAKPKTAQAAANTGKNEEFPKQLTMSDDDIDYDLRRALHKAFERQALKQGLSLDTIKKLANIEYKLECNFSAK